MPTTCKKGKPAILAIARAIRERAERDLEGARQIEAAANRGTRWVSVQDIELKLGRWYWVRRVWPDGSTGTACVEEWTPNGWRSRYGNLEHTYTGSVEVWVGARQKRRVESLLSQ